MVLKVLDEKRRNGEDEFDLDIVFLHGLKGDLEKTWIHPETKAYWARDWLPMDVPGARVMTFGYNADAAFGNSTADILDHAKDLLSSLVDKREEAEELERPLIFIGHSLGGIVIKQALFYARIDERYKTVRESTLGIIFFGTPHRGSDFATYGETLASVAHMVTGKPSSKLLKALHSNSDELYKLSTYFQSELKRLQIVSFYERQPMAGPSLIVNEYSALLLVPNEESLPVDANHSGICKFRERDDSTYEKCYKRIKRIAKECNGVREIVTTSVPGNVHWCMARGVNPLFVGRSDIINILETALLSGPAARQKRFVISGMGGAGKSEVCLKFAAAYRQRYWGVLWVDCGEASTAERTFITFAKRCGYHTEDFDDAKTWFANLKKSWLLIIDNADDIDFDYAKYFPPCESGSIIFTTRNPECSIHGTVGHEKLKGLGLRNASELLLRAAEIKESTWPKHQRATKEVVNLLGAHPLALIQAGSVIKKSFCTLNDYPKYFNERRKWFLESNGIQASSRYRNVYATFEVSANALEASTAQEAIDALHLFRILAFMHFDSVPCMTFERAFTQIGWTKRQSAEYIEADLYQPSRWLISQLPDFISRATSIEEIIIFLNQARDLLASSSLITIVQAAENVSISMHPLVHAWAKDRLTQADWQKAWLAAGSVLAMSIHGTHGDSIFHYKLLPHAQAFIAFGGHDSQLALCPDTIVEVGRIFCRLRWLLCSYHSHYPPIRVCREVLHRTSAEFQQTPSQIYSVGYALAQCSFALKEYDQTITMLKVLLKSQTIIVDSTHSHRLASQHELARAYMETGEYQKAVDLLEEVVEIKATILDPIHSHRLASQHELARVYRKIGQYQKAVDLLEEVVEIEATILDPIHSNRLASQHELALAYMEIEQHQKAVELLEEVVEIRATILDPIHSQRLVSQHELARAYMKIGQYQKAVDLLEEVIEIRITILDPIHPDRSTSQYSLARAYMKIGQHQKAVDLLEEIVEIEATILDPIHSDRLVSQYTLAKCYFKLKRYPEALQLAEEVAKIQTELENTKYADYAIDLISYIKKAMERENDNRAEMLDMGERPEVDRKKTGTPEYRLTLRRREDSGKEHGKSFRASINRIFKRS